MDVKRAPDLYVPKHIDNKYIDYIPDNSFCIRCQCGSNTMFQKTNLLKSHFKTKKHTNWLENLNGSTQNLLKQFLELKEEYEGMKQDLKESQIRFGKEENKNSQLRKQIAELTKQITELTMKDYISIHSVD